MFVAALKEPLFTKLFIWQLFKTVLHALSATLKQQAVCHKPVMQTG